ncbi:hypothetical protein NHX12_017427 [Muraenolepis orangiensis]|uniref:Uncharacterized protein n=1 Tax=Muraenolepis orangiensis TaxID=630683 RepID=A0A9Q0D7I6_9TELE|nr:hypothetical protein NHX12_017427 [Muraenolepis orangiensis]
MVPGPPSLSSPRATGHVNIVVLEDDEDGGGGPYGTAGREFESHTRNDARQQRLAPSAPVMIDGVSLEAD